MVPFATARDGFAWLESFVQIDRGTYDPRRHRLRRMRDLLTAFGNPHRSYRVVHVTGSKGKGSTAAFIAFVLAESGMRCGIYSSPHVQDFRERVRVLGNELTDELSDALTVSILSEIARHVERLRASVAERELPTTFELLTLYGFLAFERTRCDVAVVEVGIGGRTDATNLVDPVASVITPIELEHRHLLGSTHRAIAGEKGGIIKRGRPVFLAAQVPEAGETLKRVAQLRGAPLLELPRRLDTLEWSVSRHGTAVRLRLRGDRVIATHLRMPGRVQAENAALAALVVRTVFPEVSVTAVEKGLARAWLPGRAELFPGDPSVLLDGAHTVRSLELLTQTAREICPEREARVAIFGSVAGKDHEGMLRVLTEHFSRIIVARPGSFKKSDLALLHHTALRMGADCELIPDPAAALARARDLSSAALNAPGAGALIVGTGSFYLVGELRRLLASVEPSSQEHP